MAANTGITLFLCGDVMTGRGIDQILPHPGDPMLDERVVRDAWVYVRLAEQRTGPIPAPVGFDYVWGDALEVLDRVGPALRVINLETSITAGGEPWEGKEVHYRMHPANVPCLTAAAIDCCALANNHVLDWGRSGLIDTLRALQEAGIQSAGAGEDAARAAAPAVLDAGAPGRILVFAYGVPTSGVPPAWSATVERPGVNLLPDLSDDAVYTVAADVERHAREGDIILVSIHWGGNWGYSIPDEQIAFAHALVDEAGVDLIHGHSSHHIKGLEIHNRRLILYGCGDFLNDYEGIPGYERFRPDLALMYFPTVEPSTGALTRLRLAPMRIRHFRLNHAGPAETAWLSELLNRESRGLRARIEPREDGLLAVDGN
jgi:poly-gamma-glutamate capsule biosynthesis protein CapA/YwtB (metallophosphatase superfamily)